MGSLSVQSHLSLSLSLSSSSLHFEFSSRNFKCNATLSGYKLATSRCEEAVEFHYHVFSHCFYVWFFVLTVLCRFFFSLSGTRLFVITIYHGTLVAEF